MASLIAQHQKDVECPSAVFALDIGEFLSNSRVQYVPKISGDAVPEELFGNVYSLFREIGVNRSIYLSSAHLLHDARTQIDVA
jgi:hypothetical protein